MGLIIILEDIIISRDNKKIKYATKLLNLSKFRKQQNKFLIEGIRLCEDAILSGVLIEQAFLTEKVKSKFPDLFSKIMSYSKSSNIISEDLIKFISDTENPQGIVCICNKPDNIDFDYSLSNNILALEDIKDPSNIGTILRTAEAFGINHLILSENCCDIYNPKVLRGSMGAAFRIVYKITKSMPDTIYNLNNNGFTSYASVPDKDALCVTKESFKSNKCLMLIGNEANGLKNDTINACNKKITIPMLGRSESLNAAMAASILMWEMVR